jgi:hypothetical protein
MKCEKIIVIIIFIVGFVLGLWFLNRPTDDDYFACKFYHTAVKGKIVRLVQSKLLFFQIDSTKDEYYYFPITFSNVKCTNCSSKEVEDFVKLVGDSVIKEANSKFVKVKRGEKTYIIELPVKECK